MDINRMKKLAGLDENIVRGGPFYPDVAGVQKDYKMQNMIAKLDKIGASAALPQQEQLKMVYQWVKQEHANMQQFLTLVAHVVDRKDVNV